MSDVEEATPPPPLIRPEHLPQEHWTAIGAEERRLHQAIEVEDKAAIIGSLKSLAESVARVVLDLAGEPAESNANFDGTITRAHNLLCAQPGQDLANDPPFSTMTSQARKMTANLGIIRNEFGTGHGRARSPRVLGEMVLLSIDGAMVWVRWALRRLGPFISGRPGPLIDDLVGGTVFTAGALTARLRATNLPGLEDQHQKAVGVAVGQRVMQGTFVVRWDGLDPCLASDSLDPWTAGYRRGLAVGLLEDVDARLTATPQSLEWALSVMDPIEENAEWLGGMVDTMTTATPAGGLSTDWGESNAAYEMVLGRATIRPEGERPHLMRLAAHVKPESPY